MAPLWASQPFKAIYTILFFLKTPPEAIALLLRFVVKPSYPEWDAKTSLLSAVLQKGFNYCVATQTHYILYNDPGKAKKSLAKINPPPKSFFSRPIASTATVKPTTMKGEKIILHFPGGAFVAAVGYKLVGRPAAKLMTEHLHASNFFWAQYRLATDETTRFPAAIQDAVTYYQYIVSLGVDPKNIIVSGDSAGGSVVLALPRYLESGEAPPSLPLPGGAVLLSPWLEVKPNETQVYNAHHNTEADILTPEILQWGADSYLPKTPSASSEEYTSPLDHPFKTSVPIYFQADAAEALHDSIQKFASQMKQTRGNRVRFESVPMAPHDILLTHAIFGMTDEFCATLVEAHLFLSSEI